MDTSDLPNMPATFAGFRNDANNWITLATGEYYLDVLDEACQLYTPVIERFGQLLRNSATSQELFLMVIGERVPWMRRQLLRMFRRYVAPETPVEMSKRVNKAREYVRDFGRK